MASSCLSIMLSCGTPEENSRRSWAQGPRSLWSPGGHSAQSVICQGKGTWKPLPLDPGFSNLHWKVSYHTELPASCLVASPSQPEFPPGLHPLTSHDQGGKTKHSSVPGGLDLRPESEPGRKKLRLWVYLFTLVSPTHKQWGFSCSFTTWIPYLWVGERGSILNLTWLSLSDIHCWVIVRDYHKLSGTWCILYPTGNLMFENADLNRRE